MDGYATTDPCDHAQTERSGGALEHRLHENMKQTERAHQQLKALETHLIRLRGDAPQKDEKDLPPQSNDNLISKAEAINRSLIRLNEGLENIVCQFEEYL